MRRTGFTQGGRPADGKRYCARFSSGLIPSLFLLQQLNIQQHFTKPLDSEAKLWAAEDQKKKKERNPLPVHAVSGSTCQRGPLWLCRAPSSPLHTLHLLIHSLACSPFFPSGFHLVQTLEHHQHLLCVGQRPRVRPWAWTESLRHSCLSSTGSLHFPANPVQIYATVLL